MLRGLSLCSAALVACSAMTSWMSLTCPSGAYLGDVVLTLLRSWFVEGIAEKVMAGPPVASMMLWWCTFPAAEIVTNKAVWSTTSWARLVASLGRMREGGGEKQP